MRVGPAGPRFCCDSCTVRNVSRRTTICSLGQRTNKSSGSKRSSRSPESQPFKDQKASLLLSRAYRHARYAFSMQRNLLYRFVSFALFQALDLENVCAKRRDATVTACDLAKALSQYLCSRGERVQPVVDDTRPVADSCFTACKRRKCICYMLNFGFLQSTLPTNSQRRRLSMPPAQCENTGEQKGGLRNLDLTA